MPQHIARVYRRKVFSAGQVREIDAAGIEVYPGNQLLCRHEETP
jgi:hypothetical protein